MGAIARCWEEITRDSIDNRPVGLCFSCSGSYYHLKHYKRRSKLITRGVGMI